MHGARVLPPRHISFCVQAAATCQRASARDHQAYEQTLHALCVKDRDDPLTEMIAKTIIEIAQTGITDASNISALAIKELESPQRISRPRPREN